MPWSKRIYRVPAEGKIAGICAGIADLSGMDPTVVRLAAVFLCVLTGFVPLVVTYLAGWWLIPEKETGSAAS